MGPTKMTPEDQQFNINFVAEVEKHPCLFDSNSTEYKQAQVQDKAWVAVSASVGEGVDLCKKRWRNLRCCMTRYLKSVRDNIDSAANLRRKPYYLYNHMQFVVPYLKMKDGDTATYESEDSAWIKNNNSGDMGDMLKPEEEVEEEEDHEIETIDVQEEDHQQIKQSIIQSIKILPMGQESQTQETTTTYEIIEATPSKQARLEAVHVTPESTSKSQSQHQSTPHIIKTKADGNVKHYTYATVTAAPQTTASTMYTSTPTITGQYTLQQAPSSSSNHQRQQSLSSSVQQQQLAANAAADADNNFFKSLIPDIQSMSMDQKRKLKIGILRLIDEILSTT
ncbi:uncharacterized protein LOC135702338 [Ochlerotatus camptorhynchus]|uniref:uncharacterized protein LOC135702338 n=1 Tax=Ochlerotatus camptorhynchus TaxID=644619 RepID=UPI0031D7DB57